MGKLDEIPYDFFRKRLSVLCEKMRRICSSRKERCARCSKFRRAPQLSDGSHCRDRFRPQQKWSGTGMNSAAKVIAFSAWLIVECADQTAIARADEREMIFAGFVVLSDPPKAGIRATIDELKQLGIALKIITGDNTLIAEHIARGGRLRSSARILTGPEIREMSAQALIRRASEADVFAEIEPMQKERIILALKKAGQVVGYIGDGINDAPALHAADVSLSVESAVDVAREAADFVLLEHDLEVLVDGVREGRAPLPTRSSMSSSPRAQTSETCSAWRGRRSSCRFFRCSRNRFCSSIC